MPSDRIDLVKEAGIEGAYGLTIDFLEDQLANAGIVGRNHQRMPSAIFKLEDYVTLESAMDCWRRHVNL